MVLALTLLAGTILLSPGSGSTILVKQDNGIGVYFLPLAKHK